MGGAPVTEFLMSKISVLYYVFFINGTHTVLYDFSHGTHTTNHCYVRASLVGRVNGPMAVINSAFVEKTNNVYQPEKNAFDSAGQQSQKHRLLLFFALTHR